jgi:hypothetical protein
MSRIARIMAGGLSAPAATQVVGDVATALVATGASQATALALPAAINAFATVAASTGAILPSDALPGDEVEVYNGGASSLAVYPPLGGTINNLGPNASLALTTLKSGKYKCVAALGWYSILSA